MLQQTFVRWEAVRNNHCPSEPWEVQPQRCQGGITGWSEAQAWQGELLGKYSRQLDTQVQQETSSFFWGIWVRGRKTVTLQPEGYCPPFLFRSGYPNPGSQYMTKHTKGWEFLEISSQTLTEQYQRRLQETDIWSRFPMKSLPTIHRKSPDHQHTCALFFLSTSQHLSSLFIAKDHQVFVTYINIEKNPKMNSHTEESRRNTKNILNIKTPKR